MIVSTLPDELPWSPRTSARPPTAAELPAARPDAEIPAQPVPAAVAPTAAAPQPGAPAVAQLAMAQSSPVHPSPAQSAAVRTATGLPVVSRPEATTVTIPVALPSPKPGTVGPGPSWLIDQPPNRSRRKWVYAALGVVAALLAGLVLWLTAGNDDPPPVTPPKAGGEYLFQRMGETVEPARDSDCAEHAYGKVKQFLIANPCRQLTRALFITATDSGRTVYTSVAVVRMPDRSTAEKLELLVRQDDTGSVNDLLREKKAVVPGLDRLSRGGFSATTSDRDVVITESDSADRDEDTAAHKAEMKRVSVEALRLAEELG
ncbi:hypothetical protein JOD54_003608 [Actinokineospora baliensis]|uniref:hypothetical protein n=1 Tax=Actinokineospora baliensis TaxID=547056 RepID=UPI0019586795|nr:hypothetical protein [Actinokineospora baliensis]MBM7773404.1 hypothetical protein [Actinokineospora baliensis]